MRYPLRYRDIYKIFSSPIARLWVKGERSFVTLGGKCFSGTRRQLHIDVELENVGDSPALTTYTFAYLELQNTKHVKNGSNIVDMDYLPDFIKCIKANEKKSFYTL